MRQSFPFSALALAGTALLAGCSVAAKPIAPTPPPQTVDVAPVTFQPLREWEDFTGRLEAIDSVGVRARVGGFIDSTRFHEGDKVHRGELLFQIDPRPFQAEVDRASADLQRAQAKAQLAQDNENRGQRLIDQAAVAKGEFERLQSESKSANADAAAALAALTTAKLNLSFTHVTSPINGRVSKAMITQGNLVTTSDLLTTVVSDGPIYAAFNTDEQTYLKYVAAQRSGKGPVYMGLMGEDGFPHRGKLDYIDNAMDPNSGTISGRAVFDNADGKLTPGLFARIKLVSAESTIVALAPEEALGTDLGKRYVLVLGPDNRVIYRNVTLGPAIGQMRVVRAGLNPGDVVIVTGLQKVKPGDPVKPVRTVIGLTPTESASLQPAV